MNDVSFVSKVQSGAVCGPAQREYTSEAWDRAFASERDPSDADRRLHEAGHWFASKFAEARDVWFDLPRLAHDRHDLVRYFVGAINFQSVHAGRGVLNAAADATRSAAGAAAAVAWPDFQQLMSEVAGQVEHLVSSARIPLSNALAGREPGGAQRPPVPEAMLPERLYGNPEAQAEVS